MVDMARVRRLASCATLVVGPLLLLAATVTLPWDTGDDTLRTLELAGSHSGATQAGDLFAFLAILAMVPASLAVMRALRAGAPLLGLLGGAISVAGWIGAMLLVVSNELDVALSNAADPRSVATTLDDHTSWVLLVVLAVFLVGILLGPILLGAGLLRSRVVPVWAGASVVASSVLSPVAHVADVQAIDVVSAVVLLAGFASVAWLVAATPDAAWDRGEIARATRGAQEPAAA